MLDKAALKKINHFEKHIYKEFKSLNDYSSIVIFKWKNQEDRNTLVIALDALEKLRLLKYEISYFSSKVYLTGLGKNRVSHYTSWA